MWQEILLGPMVYSMYVATRATVTLKNPDVLDAVVRKWIDEEGFGGLSSLGKDTTCSWSTESNEDCCRHNSLLNSLFQVLAAGN